MIITNPPPAPFVGIVAGGTSVFNGASPGAAWTDLDLSAVVGANFAVVLLKVQNRDAINALLFRFRQEGEATVPAAQVGVSCHFDDLLGGADSSCYVVVATNAAGVVEWECQASRDPVQVWVVSYIRPA